MGILISGITNDITLNGVSVATDTEVSSAVAPKANTADLKEIGVNQTWQDVTSSRVTGTTYTNTTGKPINVCISVAASTFSTYYGCYLVINGIHTVKSAGNEGITYATGIINVIIPNTESYKLIITNGVISSWMELR